MAGRDDLDDLLGEIEDAFKGGLSSRPTTGSNPAVPRTSTTSSIPLKTLDDYRTTKSLQGPSTHHERLPPTSSFRDGRPYGSSYGDAGKPSSVSGFSKSGSTGASTAGAKSWLDDLLADTDEVNDVKTLEVKPPASYSTSSSASGPARATSLSGSKSRCTSLNLGGPRDPEGMTRVSEKKSCDNIRCMSCDFAVLRFPGSRWASDAEYMFFRNFMPDRAKLSAKLVRDAGCVAYCCQCSWTCESSLRAIPVSGPLNWTCGGHSS